MIIGLTIRNFHPASGGLQAHCRRLLQDLRMSGHEVRLVSRSMQERQTWDDFYRLTGPTSETCLTDIPVTVLGGPAVAGPLLWLSRKCVVRPPLHFLAIRIAENLFTPVLCRAFQGVDVIHHVGQAHELLGFAAASAARRMKVPFLIQPTLHPGQWGDSAFDHRLYSQADCFLVHTAFEREALRTMGLRQPCEVVGNGIADRSDGCAARFRDQHGIDGPMILFLGRKSADKGYPLLIEAFAAVRKKHPQARLVALGPGGAPSPKTPPTGLLDLGFADESTKHDALAACDLLCVPSEGESFGLVYMEAARYAKPSVARNIPVLRELLGRHAAALLVGDSNAVDNRVALTPKDLAQALLCLIEDPNLARRIGAKAREVSAEFLWPKVVGRFERAYLSLFVAESSKVKQ